MAKVTYQFDAETGKAVAGFLKIVEAQKKAERQGRKAAKVTNEGLDSMGEKLMGVAKIAAAGFGIKKGADIAVSYLRKVDEQLKAISLSLDESTKNMMAFALMQQGSPETQARLMKVAQAGSEYGMGMGESWFQFQSMQALYGGDFPKAMSAFKQIGLGRKAQVPPESSRDFIAAASAKGLESWEGVYLPYKSGQLSQMDPATLAKASIALPQWKDPYLAMAAAPEVLRIVGPDLFHTYLKNAGKALGSPVGGAGKLWEKLGVSESSELDKIKAAAEAGIETPAQLAKAGIVEQRQSMGLSAIIGAYKKGKIVSNYAGLKKDADAGYVEKELGMAEANVPLLKLQAEKERGVAKIEIMKQLGSTGTRAELESLEKQAYFTRFYDTYLGTLFGEQTRYQDIGPISQFALSRMGGYDIHREFAMRRFEEGVATPGEKQGLYRMLSGDYPSVFGAEPTPSAPASDKSIQALIDNTDALRENTESRKTESADGAIQTE